MKINLGDKINKVSKYREKNMGDKSGEERSQEYGLKGVGGEKIGDEQGEKPNLN